MPPQRRIKITLDNVRLSHPYDYRRLVDMSNKYMVEFNINQRFDLSDVVQHENNPNKISLVFDNENNQAIGWLRGEVWGQVVFIYDIFVYVTYRRLGIATALLQQLLQNYPSQTIETHIPHGCPSRYILYQLWHQHGFSFVKKDIENQRDIYRLS